MHTLVCAECNESFQHKHRGHKTCSDVCRKRRRAEQTRRVVKAKQAKDPAYYRSHTLICTICESEFKSKYSYTLTCGPSCKGALLNKRKAEIYHSRINTAKRKLKAAAEGTAGNRPWVSSQCGICGVSELSRRGEGCTVCETVHRLFISECTVCGVVGAYRYDVARCSDACQLEHKRNAAHQAKHRRRATLYLADSEPIHRKKLYDSYNWVCQICFEPIDKTLEYPDPKSVSLDHRIPISKGGPHTMANCQPAHLDCNIAKSDQIDYVMVSV